MIDPKVISVKHENITSLPSALLVAPAVSIVAPGIYQSKIFQPSYGLLQNLINFLNEFNVDPISSGRRSRGGSKKSANIEEVLWQVELLLTASSVLSL